MQAIETKYLTAPFKSGDQWGNERHNGDSWQGLQVFAVDGALLRTPDTPELRDHFGSGNTSSERQTPFPMMRLVALMNVRSHVILDAQLIVMAAANPVSATG